MHTRSGVLAIALAVSAVAAPLAGAHAAPPPPSFVRAVSVDLVGVVLYWAPPVEFVPDEAYGYRVYRSVAGGPLELLGETRALAFADLAAPMDAPLRYAIRTLDASGYLSTPVFYSQNNENNGQCVQSSSGGASVRVQDCVN